MGNKAEKEKRAKEEMTEDNYAFFSREELLKELDLLERERDRKATGRDVLKFIIEDINECKRCLVLQNENKNNDHDSI